MATGPRPGALRAGPPSFFGRNRTATCAATTTSNATITDAISRTVPVDVETRSHGPLRATPMGPRSEAVQTAAAARMAAPAATTSQRRAMAARIWLRLIASASSTGTSSDSPRAWRLTASPARNAAATPAAAAAAVPARLSRSVACSMASRSPLGTTFLGTGQLLPEDLFQLPDHGVTTVAGIPNSDGAERLETGTVLRHPPSPGVQGR